MTNKTYSLDELIKMRELYVDGDCIKALLDQLIETMRTDRWISVDEGLPEEEGHYLANHRDNGLGVAMWWKKRKTWGAVLHGEVTHWKSLPPAPEQEGRNDLP